MQHTFEVTGMTCGHCEKAVSQAIARVQPGATVVIDRAHDRVTVEAPQLDVAALVQAIMQEGYEAKA